MELINEKVFDCMDKLIRERIEFELNTGGVIGVLKDKAQRFLSTSGKVYHILQGLSKEEQIIINEEHDIKQEDGLPYKYLVYTLGIIDGKVKPIGYYLDGNNNIRTRALKMEALEYLLEAVSKIRIKDLAEVILYDKNLKNIKQSFNSVISGYTVEYVEVSKGYNLSDLPNSCQKGYGERFKFMDTLARMLLLRDKNNRIQARAYVWNKGLVEEYVGGKYKTIDKPCCDMLYYENSEAKNRLLCYLKDNDIFDLWGQQGDRYPAIGDALGNGIGAYKLTLPEDNLDILLRALVSREAPWLDCFNHLKSDTGELFSYDWKHRGYDNTDLNFGIVNNDFVLLRTEGEYYSIDNVYTVYDEYDEVMIDADEAVTVEFGDWTGETHEANAIWSDYHEGYILRENAVWVDGDEDCTYVGSEVEIVEIDGTSYFLKNLNVFNA
ncbi:hypothetical protein [Campylobacter hyointestinalis]|uniref:hypothetical protein n=1 Tax=Campylobacter hyointestinalis TaxID=198 RepID=UPI0007259843|nr:hypothetical protein [Campylobacter hyointestinalis]CUU77580.1 Uncharacterised protein [Campylobacter hyointestinalis subsp. hyointestinalis]